MFYGAVGQGIALLMVAILTKPEIIGQNPLVSYMLLYNS